MLSSPAQPFQFLLALTTLDNDYQQEQAAAAEAAARRLGVTIKIIDAENDAINQSQQLLRAIQCPANERPTAIVVEPVGTGLPRVARAAADAQIGWAVLNREVDYIAELAKPRAHPCLRSAQIMSRWAEFRAARSPRFCLKAGQCSTLKGLPAALPQSNGRREWSKRNQTPPKYAS